MKHFFRPYRHIQCQRDLFDLDLDFGDVFDSLEEVQTYFQLMWSGHHGEHHEGLNMMCDYDTHWVSLRYGPIEGTVSSSHKIDATFTVSFHRTSDCCYYDHLPDLGVTKLTDASRPYEMIFPKDSIDDPRFHFPVNRHEDDILVSIESHEDPVIYNVTCRCHTSIILIQSYDHGYVSEIERDDMYSDGRGSRYDLVSGFLLDNRFWDWPLSVERKFVRRYL